MAQQEKDSGFPFFEEYNSLGWLAHYKALLRSPVACSLTTRFVSIPNNNHSLLRVVAIIA
jgi:hypothetical protein